MKRRVSLRLEPGTLQAVDSMDANRSKVLRRFVHEGIERHGEEAPDDLRTLHEVETNIDEGRLERRRSTFNLRMYQFFQDKWESGLVSDRDAEDLGKSWLANAELHGPAKLAFAETLVDWYVENWDPFLRPEWPEPDTFYSMAEPDLDPPDRLVSNLRRARDGDSISLDTAVEAAKDEYGPVVAEQAAKQVRRD